MIRLLHTADWQIGRAFTSFDPDDAVPLAEARYAAVEGLAQMAAEQKADAVLVAGDVFDAQTVSDRCIRRLFNALAAFTGPWVMIPGNHDAALAESVWTRAQRLGAVPANVQLALAPGIIELATARTAVLCAPLTQRHSYSDLSDWFDHAATPEGWVRIGLAHGAVQGLLAEGLDATNPIALDRAERARLSYLALGDWHGSKRISERCWYSGTPEPDRFKDNDAGQVLWVEIDAPNAAPRVTPQRSARHCWRTLTAHLAVASDVSALATELARAEASEVIRLELSGAVDLPRQHELDQAIEQTRARVRSLSVERSALRLAPTAADIAALHADGYLGEVIAELRDTEGDAAPVAQEALALLTTLLHEMRADAGDAGAGA